MTEITIKEKTYPVKEIKYKEVTKLNELSKEESAKEIIILATGMSVEEYDDLSIKDGIRLQQLINKENGLSDFQQPLKD